VNFGEEGFQRFRELFVFGALVELADEVAARFEGVIGEGEGCEAEVLSDSLVQVSFDWGMGMGKICTISTILGEPFE
jgi:hypothetical protein